MRNFLFLHVRPANGSTRYLVGGMRGKTTIEFTLANERHLQRLAVWRLTDAGALELGQRPGTILGVGNDGRLELHHLPAGKTISPSDCWDISDESTLVHRSPGKSLVAKRSLGMPTSLAITDLVGDDGDQNPVAVKIEELALAIGDILDHPAATPPYPAYSDGGQPAAYAWINQTLLQGTSFTDIRQLYTQANPILGTLSGRLSSLRYPTGNTSFSDIDFQVVQEGLLTELQFVSQVISLYTTNINFYNAVIGGEQEQLTAIQNALNSVSQPPSSATLTVAVFIESILYTVFSAMGSIGSFIANIMATAFYTAMTAGAFGSSSENFDVSTLQVALGNKLDVINTNLLSQKATILSDWEKVEQVNALELSFTDTQVNDA